MPIQDRILELKRIPPNQVKANPRNWRTHPEDQANALTDVLEKVGIAGALIAYHSERNDGALTYIDGHLRQTLAPDQPWPTIILDVSDSEADLLLATLDPLADMAGTDQDLLASLAGDIRDTMDIADLDIGALIDSLSPPVFDQPEAPQADPPVCPGDHRIILGDCIAVMAEMEENSIDAIVCDPPYGLGFMGKAWDNLPPGQDWAEAALRVLKPGGHLIAFGGTRTIHRLTCALEDGGFQIRDLIGWLQWQGFPKSLDCSKAIDQHLGADREVVGSKITGRARTGSAWRDGTAGGTQPVPVTAPTTPEAKTWSGFGTALKPALEPCIMARKPLDGTVAQNLIRWGVGGINIDACRHLPGDPAWPGPQDNFPKENSQIYVPNDMNKVYGSGMGGGRWSGMGGGRWPANIYHCPKASRTERERDCDRVKATTGATACDRQENTKGLQSPRAGAGRTASTVHNPHPTVKPLALMTHLCKLITPPGGTVLDPFLGSGTTCLAAVHAGFDFIGIEKDPQYHQIALARIQGGIHAQEENT